MVVLLNIFLHFYLLINLSVRSFFLCCRDSPKLLYMVSKNSDKLHNSSWGPQEKRLFLKHSLNIKENPYKPINTVQKYLLQITYWYVFIRHNSKDFHYRQIKHENQTLCSRQLLALSQLHLAQNGKIQLRNSSLSLCIQKKYSEKLTHLLTFSGIRENFYHAV